MKSLLTLMDIDKKKVDELIKISIDLKKYPNKYSKKLSGKTLLMIFEKPSLRTRVSFEAGMLSLGGNAIVIETENTPLGKKETIEDTAKTASRYVDCIMARLFEHKTLIALRDNATVPVINGLTNDFHPVQILSDFLTIHEKKGKLKGLKLCYLGDGANNVTHCLLIGCAMMGIDISVGCPKEAVPRNDIIEYAKKVSDKSKIVITTDAKEAVKDADVIYTDSWMSYHVDPSSMQKRISMFMPYQVNKDLVKYAKNDYIFMHCLPATRGQEMTAEIIDGSHSVVFDEAENRMHMQKAILLELLR
jgi:ornithine carbamoyltransferase